jgi:hypothetical protein
MKIYYLNIPASTDDTGINLTTMALTTYLIEKSEFFSLISYNNQNEPMTEECIDMRENLARLRVASERTTVWPGNSVTNIDRSSYYEIVYYSTTDKNPGDPDWDERHTARMLLSPVENYCDWDFPRLPMDLCFYRNDLCWFSVVAHENLIAVYTDSEQEIKEILSIGTKLSEDYGGIDVENPTIESVYDDNENKYIFHIPKTILRQMQNSQESLC